jgi:hypothetical protein
VIFDHARCPTGVLGGARVVVYPHLPSRTLDARTPGRRRGPDAHPQADEKESVTDTEPSDTGGPAAAEANLTGPLIPNPGDSRTMNDAKTTRYGDDVQHAGAQLEAWSLLRMFAAREPALAGALAVIDTTDLAGPLDGTAIDVALGEARAELDRTSALAELDRRRLAAGVGQDARCAACGHNSSAHGRRLKDGRLPCPTGGCGCQDLVLEAVG